MYMLQMVETNHITTNNYFTGDYIIQTSIIQIGLQALLCPIYKWQSEHKKYSATEIQSKKKLPDEL